jgi:hypothetical protein
VEATDPRTVTNCNGSRFRFGDVVIPLASSSDHKWKRTLTYAAPKRVMRREERSYILAIVSLAAFGLFPEVGSATR